MGKYGDPAKDVSELTYSEVIDQLQILEYVELNKPSEFDEDCRRSVKELQLRERDLLRRKTLQFFVIDNLDSRDAWTRACNNPDFTQTAFHLASRHLLKDAELAERQQQDLKRLGDFPELHAVRAREKTALAREFDEQRGQLAREFLNSREPTERAQYGASTFDAQQREPANDNEVESEVPVGKWENTLMPDSPDELRREIKADEYARTCEEWMNNIRRVAAESHTGNIFKGAVETGLGTLARDPENQIVVVSANKQFTTIVDRGMQGTFDPIEFHRWVSSIDRTKLPTRYEVREGWDHAADPPLAGLLKHLDERQAQESAALTQKLDQQMDLLHPQYSDSKILLLHTQRRREQSTAFEAERNQYIEEHRAAERVREELRQRELEQAAKPEKFKSKFYEP